MRALVQRVKESSVKVDGKTVGEIKKGFNVLIGISKDDTLEDLEYMKDKIINLRVFEDENEKMNLSLNDINGELLVVSQFTLYGDCRKGRRPNFMNALGGEDAKVFYYKFLDMLKQQGLRVEAGVFGANMEVNIVNDGPVTLMLDSKRNF